MDASKTQIHHSKHNILLRSLCNCKKLCWFSFCDHWLMELLHFGARMNELEEEFQNI